MSAGEIGKLSKEAEEIKAQIQYHRRALDNLIERLSTFELALSLLRERERRQSSDQDAGAP